jgi:NTE family protein
MDSLEVLRLVESLRELPEEDLVAIAAAGRQEAVHRGHALVRRGDPSDRLFVVLSGRFAVSIEEHGGAVAEISVGETIGEIGFFADRPRMATVTALRDSSILAFDRAAFDTVVRRSARLYELILASIARRLGETSLRLPAALRRTPVPPRTVAFVCGGDQTWPADLPARLRRVFGRSDKTLLLDGEAAAALATDEDDLSHVLNRAERLHDLVVYIADPGDSPWTRKAIRQADDIVVVLAGRPGQSLNPVEEFAFRLHDRDHRRLCILHRRRTGRVDGTTGTLRERDVALHHHVALEDDDDFASLRRFVMGRAVGFVAGGGGGFGPAHLGIYKAFDEIGVRFDVLGGSSVGAAMTAGFAMLATPEALDAGTHAIFVVGKGLRRPTWPRYGLLDHTRFDRLLREQYGDTAVEDAWRPWFALATDLSQSAPVVIRSGPVWRAVRASGAIPGILPPMFTADGRMLVDGAILDNLPFRPMQAMKGGPNLLVSFGVHEVERFDVDYDSIPGRRGLATRWLNPFTRKALPQVPGPVSVLGRCLMANARFDPAELSPHDLLLQPPPFPGSSFLDFGQHTAVFQAAYLWARQSIALREAAGDPAMLAFLAAARE